MADESMIELSARPTNPKEKKEEVKVALCVDHALGHTCICI